MQGKVCVITGAASGMGKIAARELALKGAEVVLVDNAADQGAATTAELIALTGNTRLHFVDCDIACLAQVRALAAWINAEYSHLDVLINNAGRNTDSDEPTPDGFDLMFQTNFLGHFLLSNLLLDKCQRIVNLGSVMHHFPTYSKSENSSWVGSTEYWKENAVETLNDGDDDSAVVRKPYAPSKLAAILFSLELNRRYGDSKGFRSIAVNTGSV